VEAGAFARADGGAGGALPSIETASMATGSSFFAVSLGNLACAGTTAGGCPSVSGLARTAGRVPLSPLGRSDARGGGGVVPRVELGAIDALVDA
jgi:hypothetical protein